jgi:PAS domain S-box-containing protein
VAGVGEERARAAEVQNALYRIAELASAAQDMQEFYAAIQEIVGELMDARDFFIALYDAERGLISWPYVVDSDDNPGSEPIDPDQWFELDEHEASGLTPYVIRMGSPQRIPRTRMAELIEQGEVKLVGTRTVSEDWLGVPLRSAEGRTVGVLVVASYTEGFRYTQEDEDLLAFVGQHVGAALSRARAIEETRERNAELAVINSVQSALAGELEMQAIYDVVGDKIQEIFDAQGVFISVLDRATELVHFPYLVERGARLWADPSPLGRGFTTRVLETGEPLMINENLVAEAERHDSYVLGNEMARSILYVPLVTSGDARGVLSLVNFDREHAFDDADQRLLTTLAGDLSVALENARLVDETRQRNAELAVINSVQSALAGELEMEAIYDVVGDTIQEIFDAQAVLIMTLDETTGLMHFPYLTDRHGRQYEDPAPLSGFTRHVLESREPLLINGVAAVMEAAEKVGSSTVGSGEPPKSLLFVPLMTSGQATGAISLQNMERAHAFDEADQRLLTTLAGDLSVALENARLVDETRQRNAELALINSVQDALAGELELQSIYDSVGDRVRDVFDAQAVEIDVYDQATGLMHAPYNIERGVRHFPEPFEPGGFTGHVLETREPLLINEGVLEASVQYGSWVDTGELSKSVLFVPLIAGGSVTGVISLQNIDREHAFSESDQQLLETLAGSLSVALENARLVHETRQRNAELALINSVQSALAGELEMQAIYDVVGDRIQDIFDAQGTAITVVDDATGSVHFPFIMERGERLAAEPNPSPRGFTKHVLGTLEPLMLNENVAAEAERYGSSVVAGEEPKSLLFVPLVTGGRGFGVISLENFDREHAFDDADVRLLTTFAGSLSVALENARLVHETRQRNAELALINTVQAALAGELEMQAIYDVVGDKIHEIFDAPIVDICTYDNAADVVHFPYSIERGERKSWDPYPLDQLAFMRLAIESGEPMLINEDWVGTREKLGLPQVTDPEPKSSLWVPLTAGGAVTGLIALQNMDREHAFDEADQRLLTTLAGSLSVALENARLVHETRQRNAELALINSVQSALAGELELHAIYESVGDRIRDVFDAQVVDIAMYDQASGMLEFPYVIERGKRLGELTIPLIGFRKHVMETREPLFVDDDPELFERYGNPRVLQGDLTLSGLFVPLVVGGRSTGVISLQNFDRRDAFGEADQRLLTTLAGSLSVALENARLVHETRQRNAELALINSVQEALAGELEMQAIYDVVGDKIQEIFDAQVVDIGIFDFAAGVTSFPYAIERGVRFPDEPFPLDRSPITRAVLETRGPVLVNDVFAEKEKGEEFVVAQGEPARAVLAVPLAAGAEIRGRISLQNLDRPNAFSDNDVRLLTTLASSLSVALENARLVHETRQRNAELALINSVQEAIAGELDEQAIYDAVGDEIQEIFDAQAASIFTLEESTGLVHIPYMIERGERLFVEPTPPVGFSKHVLETREPLLLTENLETEAERYGSTIAAGDAPKSVLFVPLITGGRATGAISLQNVDREHAFGESDQQLLETLAGSLSVALENARLVHETRQRNAELALINGVQDAIAGELDTQAIYDAVGDRIQEIFDAQSVSIRTLDGATGLLHFPYMIERGERIHAESVLPVGFSQHVLASKETLLIVEDMDAEAERYGSPTIPGSDETKSGLFVPLVTGGKAMGLITLENGDREHAFAESDQQLLETLAGSLSVALENARLVHETRQRNAELALINGVQDAIAGELEPQAIYDAVGERIRDVFDAQVVAIVTLDSATGLVDYPYAIELGERLWLDPQEPGGFAKHVLETRESVLVNEDVEAVAEQYGSRTMAGEDTKSVLFVPLVTGGKANGVISLQNVDREHAFSESDKQLLETLAGSLSVALENARLVHETRQRNAELALINSVQDAIAGELDSQAIYDAVGDKIQEVFDAQAVQIRTLDKASGLLQSPYIIERGKRMDVPPSPGFGFAKHVMETRESVLIAQNVAAEMERYGSTVIAGESPKSILFVPLVAGGEATGVISLQNVDRERAFSESDQQLLETLAGSLSVALENARLVDETRQRNAELALINSVQTAIAGELDPQAIYDLVGDKLQEVFDAQVVDIGIFDETSQQILFPYVLERGERFEAQSLELVGFRKHVLETLQPLLVEDSFGEQAERYGNPLVINGEPPKSALFVPLIVGGRATGVVSLQNVDRTHAYGEDDQRLLSTLAGSLSVALENARLVHETRQRVSELATVNSVGQALSSQLDLDALIELVGEQVRETFDADIAYVALRDEASGQIEFPYYYETGERPPQTPLEYGEGITSQILRSREPLLRNRREQHEGQASVGTPSLSYLGVPILVGDRAIGVISVQSIEEEGRFGEGDVRLLSTLAANVGVAIQNARLFTEVERQRQYLESLVSISPAAVVVMDAGERVTDWNPAAADLFGYSAEEAVGRLVDELVFGSSGLDTEEGRELTREAITTGRAQRITQRRRRDGTLIDVELLLVPLTVEGEYAGLLAVYHDVTELQRARQEAEAATQAKSAFLATMSHEIRTPMNAVIGMTDLLLGTELTGEQREFAEVVHSSGDALLHVIDDILDYSKIEAGKLDLEHQPFNLRDCVEGALDIVAPRAWEKEIELGCLIDEGAPAGVVGDEARLRQVLLNLLSNAVKFTDAGEVAVLVDAEATGPDRYRVDIAVRDTGIGIPTDRMDRLFTSFSQVDASTTRKFGGTGLGLAISKRLVELMGGTISVESQPQRGSTFHISLPVAEVEVPAKIALEDGLAQLAGKRVLVVDDNATNREIVTRHARSWGMEPVAVELPAEALALVEAGEPFDIAVLDMMMPVMDGLALAGAIREHRDAEELPLLLLTSLGHLPQAESGSVFSAQLAKPFKASQLYNTLLRLLTPGAAEEEVEPVTDTKRARSALRILLAEDNAMNQKVALRLLEQLGYRADVANNGLEAIAALERQPYDVVLMDVQMPELDGLDATRRICEQWPEETRPHIIAMTANALPEDREACFAAGMNDYVAKPIRAEELVAALKRAKPLRNGDGGDVALDAAALGSLRDLGGDEFLREVIDAFLTDAPDQIATLRRSLADQSTEELRRAAHTLKSNGATLGAEEFAGLCRTLEQRAKDGELDGASELVDRIEQEYGPLQGALTALRSEPVS